MTNPKTRREIIPFQERSFRLYWLQLTEAERKATRRAIARRVRAQAHGNWIERMWEAETVRPVVVG